MDAAAGSRRRVWTALGTPGAVRIVTLMMLLYAVVIGALVFGYAKVQSCVTDYANSSASATKARADAAADDRRLDGAESTLDDSDRVRYRADSRAMSQLLAGFTKPNPDQATTKLRFENLLVVDAESSRILDANDGRRQEIRQERARIEAQRAKNPPPPPPSETC